METQSKLSIRTVDDNLQLDDSRLFYHEGGQFRHSWDTCEIDTHNYTVTVKWASGHEVVLRGQDALKFLEITRSRYVRRFMERLETDAKRAKR